MSNLYAIFLFVSSLVLAADADTHCAQGNQLQDDVVCAASTNLKICEYTPKNGAPKFTGAADCVEENYVNYPCIATEAPYKCYQESSALVPDKKAIEETCENAKSQACKEKKKCFKDLISAASILKCKADAAMCKYTADGSGVFSGENECVAKDKEEFYNYPCKNGTVCFIDAAEAPPTE